MSVNITATFSVVNAPASQCARPYGKPRCATALSSTRFAPIFSRFFGHCALTIERMFV